MHWSSLRNLAAFAMLLFGACSPINAQSQPVKVVTFKLEDYGWQPLPKEQVGEWAGDRRFDFSMSPDGHRLAILDEGVLTVYDVP
jgi:hypothetical protein